MVKIEIPQRSSNVIYGSDDGKRYYLVVHTNWANTDRRKKEWGKKTPAYMFDGNHFTSNQFPPVVFKLLEYIKLNNRSFTIGGGGRPLSKCKDLGRDLPLANVLYGFYNGIDIEQTIDINVRCVNSDAVVLNDITDREENEFLKNHYVYNFTRGNLVSDIGGAVIEDNVDADNTPDFANSSCAFDKRSYCPVINVK